MYAVLNHILCVVPYCREAETQHNYTVRPLVECKYVHRDLAQWPKTYNWLVGFCAGNQQQLKSAANSRLLILLAFTLCCLCSSTSDFFTAMGTHWLQNTHIVRFFYTLFFQFMTR